MRHSSVKALHRKGRPIINIGISGSTQYLAGMQNSKCIVSVNTNETAPIMAISNYSIVADYPSAYTGADEKLH